VVLLGTGFGLEAFHRGWRLDAGGQKVPAEFAPMNSNYASRIKLAADNETIQENNCGLES
jgi:hypothetical protein